jgi:cholest-4-en-3-one 26-monooxygenase
MKVVSDIDAKLTSNAYFATSDFYRLFKQLRAEDPVHWTDGNYGRPWWCLTRYPDIAYLLENNDTFSSELGGNLPPDVEAWLSMDQYAAGFGSMPTFLDGERHDKLRQPFNRHFTMPMVTKRLEGIQQICRDLIDEVGPRGKCDLVEEIAAELPNRVTCVLMGLPRDDWHLMKYWAGTYRQAHDPKLQIESLGATQTMLKVQKEMYDYMIELALERRKNPTGDLTSLIANMKIDGELWDMRDVGWWCWTMILGGLETTRGAFAMGVNALMENPHQLKLLKSDLSLMDTAVEEILRWGPAVKHKLRVATRDVEIGGKMISKGDWVVGWIVSGNRDEEIFENADRFDITRKPNPHLTFGVSKGAHFCLGRNLARLELKTLLTELITRLDNLDWAEPVEWVAADSASGPLHMHIKYMPTQPSRSQAA